MLTAQATLIIAGVAFVAVAITGSRQFAQIKIPELKLWSRLTLGIIGAGLFPCAFLIPTVTGQSSDPGFAASTSPASPTGAGTRDGNSSVPAVSRSSRLRNPTPTPGTPIVIIDTPRNNADVSYKGFATTGTVSSLGTGILWLFDDDGGSNYSIDEPVTATTSGEWYASEGNLGHLSKITIAIVLANQSCNRKLNQLNTVKQYNLSGLPSGCHIVAEVTVKVTRQ
jgi:hypothetical protein